VSQLLSEFPFTVRMRRGRKRPLIKFSNGTSRQRMGGGKTVVHHRGPVKKGGTGNLPGSKGKKKTKNPGFQPTRGAVDSSDWRQKGGRKTAGVVPLRLGVRRYLVHGGKPPAKYLTKPIPAKSKGGLYL